MWIVLELHQHEFACPIRELQYQTWTAFELQYHNAIVSQFLDVQLPIFMVSTPHLLLQYSAHIWIGSTWPMGLLHQCITLTTLELSRCFLVCHVAKFVIRLFSFSESKSCNAWTPIWITCSALPLLVKSQVYFLFELEFLFLLSLFKERSIYPSYL
jgi:hypothetical protein